MRSPESYEREAVEADIKAFTAPLHVAALRVASFVASFSAGGTRLTRHQASAVLRMAQANLDAFFASRNSQEGLKNAEHHRGQS